MDLAVMRGVGNWGLGEEFGPTRCKTFPNP